MDVTALGAIGPSGINAGTAGGAKDGSGFGFLLGAIDAPSASTEALTPAVGASAQPVLASALGLVGSAVPGDELAASSLLAQQPDAAATKASLLASAAAVDTNPVETLAPDAGAEVPTAPSADAPMPLVHELVGKAEAEAEAATAEVKPGDAGDDIPVDDTSLTATPLPEGKPDAGEALASLPGNSLEIGIDAPIATDKPREEATDVAVDTGIDPAAPSPSKPELAQTTSSAQTTSLAQPQSQAQPQMAEPKAEDQQDLAAAVKQPGQPAREVQTAGTAPTGGSTEPAGQPFAQLARSASAEQPQANTVQLPGSVAATSTEATLGQQTAPQAQAASHHQPVIPFRADKVAREMGLEIARRVTAGNEELVIRLDPAELGRINIRMAMNEHGQLRAIVAADAPAVLEALRGDIAELNRALEQAGVRTDSQSFRFDRGGSGDSGGQWQQRYQQQASTRHGGDQASAMAEDEHAYRPMATNGRINVMA